VLFAQGVIAIKPRAFAQGLLACLFFFGGCQRPQTTTEPQRSTPASRSSAAIEVLVPAEIDVLDPRIASDAFSVRASRLIHAGLFRLDPNTLAPEPNLAASFQWETPLRLRVQLRKGIFFRTGEELQASDVAASLAAFASEGSRQRRVVEAISGTELLSPHELVVILREPHATLLSDLELPILRAVDARKPPRAPGDDIPGLGPYDCKLHALGLLELAPASGARAPKSARTLLIRTIRDENARAMRLLSGRAHVASSVLSPTTVRAVEKAGLTIKKRPGANTAYLLIRHEGTLKDVTLRRAIAESIDRTSLTDGLFEGTATPAATFMPEALWAHATLPPLAHEPAKARATIQALRTPAPAFTLLTSTDRLRNSVARVVASQLEDVGLRITHRSLELGTLLARLSAGSFELAILQIPEFTEPNLMKTFLHKDLPPPRGLNRGRYEDALLSQWLDEAEQEMNATERLRRYRLVEERIRSEWPLVPLWHEAQVVALAEGATSFLPSAEGRLGGLAELSP
jgi:peptide/nickel transport system substrate-binding protein